MFKGYRDNIHSVAIVYPDIQLFYPDESNKDKDKEGIEGIKEKDSTS